MGRGVPDVGFVMLAIFSLFAMALAAVLVIDPTTEVEEAEGVSDLDDGMFMGQAKTMDIVDADEASTSNQGTFFDLRDQTNVTAFGTDDPDVFISGPGFDYLSGRDGDDTLSGGAGIDELHGDLGDDLLFGGEGDDALLGHVGDDRLFGEAGDDELTGGDGHDLLDGGDGNDSLSGNLGNDTMVGGFGRDVLFGGAGDDTLSGRGDQETDFLNGGQGNDVVVAGAKDQVSLGEGDDTLKVTERAEALVTDFDPLADQIELEYEGNTPPVLSVEKTADGVELFADGYLVMALADVEELDLNQIRLIRIDM